MDIDHSARYLAQKFYKIRDPDYYEFEGIYDFDHIKRKCILRCIRTARPCSDQIPTLVYA